MAGKTSRLEEPTEWTPDLPEDPDDDPPGVEDLDLHERIAALAYAKAEQRGFESGHELEDWLDAELELTK